MNDRVAEGSPALLGDKRVMPPREAKRLARVILKTLRQRKRQVALLVGVALCAATCLWALARQASPDDAAKQELQAVLSDASLQALGQTNFADTTIRKFSDSPDVRAKQLCAVGKRYEHGDGVALDKEAAAYYYYQAAKLGNLVAAHKLAMHCENDGSICEPRTTLRLYKAAANLNYAPSQIKVARAYDNGEVVERDAKVAAHWYRKAATAGDPAAQHALGVMYERGRGVVTNKQSAFHWYKLAAKSGAPEDLTTLGTCYMRGIGTKKNYAVAHQLFARAAKENYGVAYTRLGEMSELGLGGKQDLVEAARDYHSALLCSDHEGRSRLGALAGRHGYVLRSLPAVTGAQSLKSIFLRSVCEQALPLAQNGDPQAEYLINVMCNGGRAVPKTAPEANGANEAPQPQHSLFPNTKACGAANLRLIAQSAMAAMSEN